MIKSRTLLMAAVAVLSAGTAMAQNAGSTGEPQSTSDGLNLAFSTDIPHRYVSPRVVGFSPENIPASALTPVPPNTEQIRHSYALGEASVPFAHPHAARLRRVGYEDPKGRATHDRRPQTAWAGRHAYD